MPCLFNIAVSSATNSLPSIGTKANRGGAVVARFIRNRMFPGSNPAADVTAQAACCKAGNLHTLALGRLSPTIPARVHKNGEQLCAAATTDTFTRFTSPEPGNS